MLCAFKLINETAHTTMLDTWAIIVFLIAAIPYQTAFSQMLLPSREDAIILGILKVCTTSSAKLMMWIGFQLGDCVC